MTSEKPTINQKDLFLMSMGVVSSEFNTYIYPLIEKMLNPKPSEDFSRLHKMFEQKDKINCYINDLLQERHFKYFEYIKFDTYQGGNEPESEIRVFLKLDNKKHWVDCEGYDKDGLFEKMYAIQNFIKAKDKPVFDFFKTPSKYENVARSRHRSMYDYNIDNWKAKSKCAEINVGIAENQLSSKLGRRVSLCNVNCDYLKETYEEGLNLIEYTDPNDLRHPGNDEKLNGQGTQKIKVF